ncbi:MAG: ABC transporter ATP-binding protein [Methanomassiliicoccaceae archaeon]|nr:ABC transporter ATP-binding protein [Methanomassiliicoccaceae archaeon]
MPSDSPIEIVDLRREYGQFVAVNNLDLNIRKNSFTGFLGPNGAGKSTTLKILTHLINATSGNAYLNGVDVVKDPKEALSNVGTVVETPEFYTYLTPIETMKYIGEILGMSHEAIKSETDIILEKVKMTEWADKRIGTFSKGMRQRIALGQALMNSPSIIILDEPTSGLDPRGMAETREILKNLRNEKSLTVLMSSHLLYEVGDLCDRVAIINHGALLVHDDIDNVIKTDDTRRITVKLNGTPTQDLLGRISALQNVVSAERLGNDIEIRFKGDANAKAKLFSDLGLLNVGIYELSEQGTLETTYLNLIAESR